jgi:small subunit ribosomal protein S2
MKDLLEAGVHFGHQTRRWNPKMKNYIFGERNGIHIIDLQKTVVGYGKASEFVRDLAAKGGNIIFVGTKKQAKEAVREEAERCGMAYVTERWLGGTLTNFKTIKGRIDRLRELSTIESTPRWEHITKREKIEIGKEKATLEKAISGIREMHRVPDAIFVIDPNNEKIAVAEANALGVMVVAVVDTNCDPDVIDYIIPGNDDAIRAVKLFSSKIADAVLEGKAASGEEHAARDGAVAAPAAVVEAPAPVAAPVAAATVAVSADGEAVPTPAAEPTVSVAELPLAARALEEYADFEPKDKPEVEVPTKQRKPAIKKSVTQ